MKGEIEEEFLVFKDIFNNFKNKTFMGYLCQLIKSIRQNDSKSIFDSLKEFIDKVLNNQKTNEYIENFFKYGTEIGENLSKFESIRSYCLDSASLNLVIIDEVCSRKSDANPQSHHLGKLYQLIYHTLNSKG